MNVNLPTAILGPLSSAIAPESHSDFLPGVRCEGIMDICGGPAERTPAGRGLRPALEHAVASGRGACGNVSLEPHVSHLGHR